MKIDLKKLFDGVQEDVCFSRDLDLSEVEQWGTKPFKEPVPIQGKATNRTGIVSVEYTACLSYTIPCARCLAPIHVQQQQIPFHHIVVRGLNQEDNDDFVVVPDGHLELQELVEADVILELPIKVICSEECKGLCPQCGTNLNEKVCDCKPAGDQRFSVLDGLFEK